MQTPSPRPYVSSRHERPNKIKYPEPLEILEDMCNIFEESIEDVKSRKKPDNLVIVRQLYAFVASLITKATQDEISGLINRERTNIVYHVALVKNWVKKNDEKFMKSWTKYSSTSKIWKQHGKKIAA